VEISRLNLNARANELCRQLVVERERLRIAIHTSSGGTRIIDCGIEALGGLEAGRRLAEICMSGLGRVEFVPASAEMPPGLAVAVATDHPAAACMASQYAGWEVKREKFFAMGSGPMRALAAKEPLFAKIGCREKSDVAVGILETRKLPPDEVCRQLADACAVVPENLTLLVAPTASRAGTVQVVARSIETALHKLSELEFDLNRVVSGWGTAPLPCVAGDDLVAIGRTNDAILYGGEVTLWVTGDDASLEAIGPRVPSAASSDHGQPFAVIFEKYGRDFYKIDPHLFSPAAVTLANVDTGRTMRFGRTLPHVVQQSFDVRQASG
jgi:methenyltetrahydromethanopterin cyclohydrolase